MPAQDSVCISYARVSSGRQRREGAGIERQLEMAQEYATANGLRLDNRLAFQDAGKSGSKGEHIAKGGALGQILEAVRKGQLGPTPTLLVEDASRLSRLELMDGLDKVLFPLIRSGCRIVLLEDGSIFDEARINSDSTAMILLCLKFQAAADYAKKRSQYAQKNRERNRKQILEGQPVCAGWAPSWIELRDGKWQFNDYAPTVQRLLDLLRVNGTQVTAKTLNLEGHRSPMGGTWTQSSVRRLLDNPALHGARRIAEAGHVDALKAWKAAREEWAAGDQKEHPPARPNPVYQEVEDIFPALLSRKDYDSLLAVIQKRARNPKQRGRRDQIRYVGQMATRCVCGAVIGTRFVKSDSKTFGYLFCRGPERGETDCKRKPFKLDPVQMNLLSRLKASDLAALLQSSHVETESKLKALLSEETRLQAEKALAEAQHANAVDALKAAIKAGKGIDIYEETVAETKGAIQQLKQSLAGVMADVQGLQGDGLTEELQGAVKALLVSFANGSVTVEQRRSVNRLIHQLGIEITLDKATNRCGLSIGDGEIDWQPVTPMDREAMRLGMVEAERLNITVDSEMLAALQQLAAAEGVPALEIGKWLQEHLASKGYATSGGPALVGPLD